MIPQISVVCPTFNGSQFVISTLQSVLAQTVPPVEIVISDDGSRDQTVTLIMDYLARNSSIKYQVLENRHQGPGATRNVGIQQAQGEWIAFIDSDDLWLPNKLEVISGAILKNPEANFFCHSEREIQTDGTESLLDYGRWFDPHKALPAQLYHRNFFSTSAVTCQRSLLCKAGLFDATLPSSQDYELWLRMSPAVKPHFVGEVLGVYRCREGNITSGRAWARWSHLIRIALRHRQKVSPLGVMTRVLRVTASFGIQAVKRTK